MITASLVMIDVCALREILATAWGCSPDFRVAECFASKSSTRNGSKALHLTPWVCLEKLDNTAWRERWRVLWALSRPWAFKWLALDSPGLPSKYRLPAWQERCSADSRRNVFGSLFVRSDSRICHAG